MTPLAPRPGWGPLNENERQARLAPLSLPASFVLAVGNLHPRKNIPRLIRAVCDVRSQGVGDIHLVLAGQRGWKAEAVDEAIESVGALGWVHFLGYVADETLQALYGQASVVAYPSLYEGFGLPVVEALACGAVVVAANASAIPEVVGDSAILVDPTDASAITAGLITALSNDSLRARLIVAAPKQAARFSWEQCAELTAQAYRTALNR